MTSSSPSRRDAAAVVAQHDPAAHTRPIARRSDAALPFDVDRLPADLPVMFDTGFYIDRLQRKLASEVLNFVESRFVLHSGVACDELAICIGILDPSHPKTPQYRTPIVNLLATIDMVQTIAPSATAWVEAGIIAGILARTQHLNRSRRELTEAEYCCQKGKRRKLLKDALIFLSAVESDAILVSGNVVDVDLLLRFKPTARVLLYRKAGAA